jgi:hypothetical protein
MNGLMVMLLWLLGLAVVINVVALVDYRRRSKGTHHK